MKVLDLRLFTLKSFFFSKKSEQTDLSDLQHFCECDIKEIKLEKILLDTSKNSAGDTQ